MDENASSGDQEHAQSAEKIDDLIRQRRFKDALPLAIERVDQSATSLGVAPARLAEELNRLADIYRALGDYAAAEPLYRKAVDAIPGESTPQVSTSLNGLAVTLLELGEYAAAEPLLRRALTIDLVTVGEKDDAYVATLSNLGMLKFLKGEYAAAEPLLRQAADTRRGMGEDDPRFAQSLNNLAGLYQTINKYGQAEDLFKQALQIRRKRAEPLDIAQSLNNLALLYRQMDKLDTAEKLYLEAAEIYRSNAGEDTERLAKALNNLAGVYFARGEYEKAQPLVSSALGIRRALPAQTWTIAVSLNSLATLSYAAGNLEQAERQYREAIEAYRRLLGPWHPRLSTSLENLALLYIDMHREREALPLMREAIEIDDRTIDSVFSITSERQRLAYVATIQYRLENILSVISRNVSASDSVVCEAMDMVLRRKGIVAESVAAQRDTLLGGKYPDHEANLRELRGLRMRLAKESLAGPGPEGPLAHAQQLAKLAADMDRLESELARELPELSLRQRLRSANRRDVAQALPEGAVVVEFVRFAGIGFGIGHRREQMARYAAFIMAAGLPDKVRLVDLGDAEEIERMVERFRALTSREPTPLKRFLSHIRPETDFEVGTALRAKIFDPLGIGPGEQSHLFLAPEGALAWIPFEALPSAGGGYLIDHYTIVYLSVGRDILRFGATSPNRSGEAVVIADADFDLVDTEALSAASLEAQSASQVRESLFDGLYFPRLTETRIEGEQVGQMLGVQPLLGDAATERSLKQSQAPRILHLATHGFFRPDPLATVAQAQHSLEALGWNGVDDGNRAGGLGLDNPMVRSGLALAGANTWLEGRTEDGVLNAIEVLSLDLLATDLVVMSACETGLGTVRVWEGVFGLRRAFALAGAKTLVMSLWKVPDPQTRDLMLNFYRQLLAGTPRAEALREAQRELKKRYPNPFYWAAFICQGDAGPVALPPFGDSS